MSFNFNQTPGFSFGSTPTTTNSQPSLFGSTQTATFGQSAGQAMPSFGGFSGQTSQQPLFGTQSQTTFGSTPFGTSSAPAFGATSPGFGATPTQPQQQPTAPSVFGSFGTTQQTAPAFGGTGFGAQSTPTAPASAAPSSLFPFQPTQQQSTPLFGSQTPSSTASVFGSPFGAAVTPQTSQPSLFGAASQPTPQQPTLGSFGSGQAFGTGFGQSSTTPAPAFGGVMTPTAPASSATPLFGSTPTLPTSSAAPTSSAPTFGGFGAATGFGGAPAAVPTAAAPAQAFNFGAGIATATTTTPTLSFSLTSTPSTISTSASMQPFGTTTGFGMSTGTVSSTVPASAFGFGAPTAPTAAATAPSFSFPSATTAAPTAAVQPLISAPAVAPIATTSSTPAFNFASATPTTTPTFGLSTPSTTNVAPTAPVAPFGLNLTAPSTTTPTATIAPAFTISTTSSATSKTPSFAMPTTTSTSVTVTTAQSLAAVAATPIPTRMTFRQLEDQINIWLNELNQLEAEFHIQAQTINSWDSLLINNGLKITHINEALDKLRTDHTRLDHQLDFIIAQQNELEQLLTPIEAHKFEMSTNNAVNAEREFTYSQVETVHNDLNGIGTDLKSFIRKLNDLRANQDTTDPLAQMAKILNSHMDALQWIENQIKTIKITN